MTTLEKVQDRIRGLINERELKLEAVSQKRAALAESAQALEEKLQQAAREMNTKAYAAAKAEREECNTEFEMLEELERQIRKSELVTEAESEQVIASLLAYEQQLEEEYRKAVVEHLQALDALSDQHRLAAADAETTLNTWTSEIRANYINTRTTYQNGTHRSPVPVPIHPRGYFGGRLVSAIDKFLTDKNLLEAAGLPYKVRRTL